MKIGIIGPGIMEIPPRGWGAVETIIHEYQVHLAEAGWDVLVVNTRDKAEIAESLNRFQPDFVHCQYDELVDALAGLNCKAKAITSHFGYLDQVWNYAEYVRNVHRPIVQAGDVYIFALSPSIAEIYRKDGVNPERILVSPNGVSFDRFRFTTAPAHADRSIYLAKVDYRKRQGLFQPYDAAIDFVGNLCPNTAITSGFDPQSPDYLGEWSREDVYAKLTDYANLVLLSDGEAHPLVCLEAMAAGLGLVISQYAAANLDLTRPFIDVIPEDKIRDKDYVRRVITENRQKSAALRSEIRQYAEAFSWKRTVSRYMRMVEDVCHAKPLLAHNQERKKKSLAIFTIATGAYYDKFFRAFEISVWQKLSEHYETKLVCFTDYKGGAGAPITDLIETTHQGWPFDTLLRYHRMLENVDKVMAFDTILYMDADMIVNSSIDESIFDADLVAVEHPGFYHRRAVAPFEADGSESSYIAYSRTRPYLQGCFWGGKPFAFKEMLVNLTRQIDRDLAQGRIPVWHDESYLNWFLSQRPYHLLSPAYAYPEGSNLQMEPVVIHRQKDHGQVRGTAVETISVHEIMRGLSLEEQLTCYKRLYLVAHEKNQRLEGTIILMKAGEPLLLRAWNRLNFLVPRLAGLALRRSTYRRLCQSLAHRITRNYKPT